ncbi:MAG: hypothetical protein D6729_14930, partial [Deltaproteobacteria bacterium]
TEPGIVTYEDRLDTRLLRVYPGADGRFQMDDGTVITLSGTELSWRDEPLTRTWTVRISWHLVDADAPSAVEDADGPVPEAPTRGDLEASERAYFYEDGVLWVRLRGPNGRLRLTP